MPGEFNRWRTESNKVGQTLSGGGTVRPGRSPGNETKRTRGPMGWPMPSARVVSMSSLVATPFARRASASCAIRATRPGVGTHLLEREDRLVDKWHEKSVRDEPGRVGRDGDRFAHRDRERARALEDGVGRLERGDQLDELHHRYRVDCDRS